MWHSSVLSLVLAIEGLCLEQAVYVKVAWAPYSELWHMPGCGSQICVANTQSGIITSIIHQDSNSHLACFIFQSLFFLSNITLYLSCLKNNYSLLFWLFLCICLIKAHIFYSKLPKLLMLCEVHEQFPFPEIVRNPSEMLLNPLLIQHVFI